MKDSQGRRILSGSPEARLVVAMANIAETPDGRILVRYLREVALSLSAFDESGRMLGPRRTAFHEGQRQLAIKLLGWKADAQYIQEGE